MDRIRLILAVIAAKLILLFCRITGSRGSATPGKYARALCPQVIALLAAKVKRESLLYAAQMAKRRQTILLMPHLCRRAIKPYATTQAQTC